MIRLITSALIVAGLAGCAELGPENRRGSTSIPQAPEPTPPLINISGEVRIGVSTGG